MQKLKIKTQLLPTIDYNDNSTRICFKLPKVRCAIAAENSSEDNLKVPGIIFKGFLGLKEGKFIPYTLSYKMTDIIDRKKEVIDILEIENNNPGILRNLTDTSNMFNNYYEYYDEEEGRMEIRCNFNTILNLDKLDTRHVTNMRSMFGSDDYENDFNKSFTSLDLHNFNTSKVTDMSYMFNRCHSLESLDLTSFNTKKVNTMNAMFSGCISLSSLNLSSFDMSNVIDMEGMFSSAAVTNIIVGNNFNTSNVTNMKYLFGNSGNGEAYPGGEYIESVENNVFDIIPYLNTDNVIYLTSMFYNTKGYNKPINISNFSFSNAKSLESMFENSCFTEITFGTDINMSKVTNLTRMFSGSNAEKINNLEYFDTSNAKDMSYLFYKCKAKELNISNWNTSNVTDMRSMFNSSAVESLDLSTWNIDKLNYIYGIFGNCNSLKTLSLFDITSNPYLRDYHGLFSGCSSLEQIEDIFSKGNVIDFSNIFYKCSSLPNDFPHVLDCSSILEKDKVSDICKDSSIRKIKIRDLFEEFKNIGNSNLTVEYINSVPSYRMATLYPNNYSTMSSVNLNNINLNGLTKTNNMFYNCGELISLNLSSLNTSNVKSMRGMFYGCNKLYNIIFGNNFDTSNVEDMSSMFRLTNTYVFAANGKSMILDLSMFDTHKVTDMSEMFRNNYFISNIIFGNNWDTSNVVNMSKMFYAEGVGNFPNTQIQNLDLSNWNTSSVMDLSNMFSYNRFNSLNLSNWDLSNAISTANMFYQSNINSLDLSGWDTSNIENMNYMFKGCNNLPKEFPWIFDMSNIKETPHDMFKDTNVEKVTFKNVPEDKKIYFTPYALSDKREFKIEFIN